MHSSKAVCLARWDDAINSVTEAGLSALHQNSEVPSRDTVTVLGSICLYAVWIFNLSLSINRIFLLLLCYFTSATKRLAPQRKKLHRQDFQAPAENIFHASLKPQRAAVAMRSLRRRQRERKWLSAWLIFSSTGGFPVFRLCFVLSPNW